MINLSTDYYWPDMEREVNEFIRSCELCAKAKHSSHTERQGLLKAIIPRAPFELVHMDHVGPLPISSEGYQWILTIMDAFTGMVVAVPCAGASNRNN